MARAFTRWQRPTSRNVTTPEIACEVASCGPNLYPGDGIHEMRISLRQEDGHRLELYLTNEEIDNLVRTRDQYVEKYGRRKA